MEQYITEIEYYVLRSMKPYGANWLKFNQDTAKWQIRKSKTGESLAEFAEHYFTFYRFATHNIDDLIKQYKPDRKKYNYTGRKVLNKNSGVVGVILRITDSGSIQVLEKIKPYVLCTHDSWTTLELLD